MQRATFKIIIHLLRCCEWVAEVVISTIIVGSVEVQGSQLLERNPFMQNGKVDGKIFSLSAF